MARVVIVGGGIIGTMHARAARKRGHTVVQLEADAEARDASVRNFGLIWVSGRAPGEELGIALRARELWADIGAEIPAVGFRPDGSLTIAQHPGEVAVLEELCAQPDASDRGLKLLDPGETRARNPAVLGTLLAALLCERDAIVEPGRVLPAIRDALRPGEGYTFLPARAARDVGAGFVRDHTGARHDADLVIVCPGATYTGVASELLMDAPLQRCRLQMMQTAPHPVRLTTALADGDSMRYYAAFRLPGASALPTPAAAVVAHRAQLLVAQRASGALTIGDTHEYDEPYDFAVEEEPYAHLRARAESILGGPLPAVTRRWAGVYSQCTDDRVCFRARPDDGVVVVTGLGGRGMTLSPAVAEATFAELGA